MKVGVNEVFVCEIVAADAGEVLTNGAGTDIVRIDKCSLHRNPEWGTIAIATQHKAADESSRLLRKPFLGGANGHSIHESEANAMHNTCGQHHQGIDRLQTEEGATVAYTWTLDD